MNKQNTTDIVSIEDRALPTWTIRVALEEMKEYRTWEENTYKAYLKDAERFEDFSLEHGFEPTLEGIKLHHVQKYIKHAKDEEAYRTTKRVIAALSSVFSFYQTIGTITHNPFKASRVPVGKVGHHSRALEFDEIVDVFEAIELIKDKEGKDLSVTTQVMFFTGLRNDALKTLQVRDVLIEKALISYDPGVINNKHVVQFFPIPPKLLEKLKHHIDYFGLQPEEQLLHGLSGQDLKNKQLNRVTDRINKELGWINDKHITPHGYRASIATILDERGFDRINIKYLLGHTITKDNVDQYLRRDNRKIRALRTELTKIEEEIYEALEQRRASNMEETHDEVIYTNEKQFTNQNQQPTGDQAKISMHDFVALTKTNPQLAQALAAANLVAM
ncbi:site-specific integrase [Bacillus sp. JJ1533]|uniref:tyrosine-type recombinase/integrase n=1 Tax=Bacillus sp. JJ1533 TaxID=3122959 RepID=UPI002FFFB6C2